MAIISRVIPKSIRLLSSDAPTWGEQDDHNHRRYQRPLQLRSRDTGGQSGLRLPCHQLRTRCSVSNSPGTCIHGLTLVEVLVGMLLTFAFIGTALQALVVSTAFRVKAQATSEAITWIQEDLENIKFEAQQLDYDVMNGNYQPDAARCSATTPNAGYADLLRDRLESQAPNLDTLNMPQTSTLNSNKTSQMGTRTYQLTREITPDDAVPYNVLQVSYTVNASDRSEPIATLYAEVLPDVSLTCG